jgi:hypothetical protein
MKKLIVFGLVLAVLASAAFARRPQEKAGSVEGLTYTDDQYGFKLTLSDKWKFKINTDKDNFRLVLTQKNYQIPPDYLDAPDYTQVPRLVVFADTSSMAVMPFLDSLLSESFSSKQKKDLLKELEILNDQMEGREAVSVRQKKAVSINENRAVVWSAQGKYTKEVSLSTSDTGGGKRVQGAFGGAIVVVKKDNTIVVFHMMCEWVPFPAVFEEAMGMINSLQFVKAGS